MRAISLNRQTGVLPHGFSRLEYLAQARSPPKSTQGSASPLLFGQDLVKVSASHFEPATFALARRPSRVNSDSHTTSSVVKSAVSFRADNPANSHPSQRHLPGARI